MDKGIETSKAKARREREGFFTKYCNGFGLDVGYGGDMILPTARGWDKQDGDAENLVGIPDNTFDYVYSSHCLEHLVHPEAATEEWWRVIKQGGYLLLYLPHRDLYEKKLELPSRWNGDHKSFWLPERSDNSSTIGLREFLEQHLPEGEILYIKTCDEGHTITDPIIHSDGEYSIEAVIRKPFTSY